MSLSNSTLSAIQKVGAAAFAADAKLKNTAKELSQQVHAAMENNPYHLTNDSLFQNWKAVARLAQTMTGIEQEIKKIYQAASELSLDDQLLAVQIPALAAPMQSVGLSTIPQDESAPTDVVAKKTKKTRATNANTVSVAKSRVAKKTTGSTRKKAPAPNPTDLAPSTVSQKTKKKAKSKSGPAKSGVLKATVESAQQKEPSGNSAKLLQHLQGALKQDDFTAINQTEIGNATGIPNGSIGAAIKNLVELGRIVAGSRGAYKLTAQ